MCFFWNDRYDSFDDFHSSPLSTFSWSISLQCLFVDKFTISVSRIYIRMSLSFLSSQLALGYKKKESKELHSCFSYDRKSHAYFNSNSSIDLLYILTWIYLYISSQRGHITDINCHLPDKVYFIDAFLD